MISFGGSQSKARSESRVPDWQRGYFEALYRNALQVLQGQGDIQGAAQGLVDEFLPTAEAGLGGFEDVIGGTDPGQAFLANSMAAENPYLAEQIDAIGGDINRNLSQNILPEIRSGGVAVGNPGGSRAGIAEGLAYQGAQRDFRDASTQLRFNDLLRRTGAADSYTRNRLGAAAGAVQGAGQTFNLGLTPYSSAWMPSLNFAQVIGDPVTESRAKADKTSISLGF